MRESLKKKAFYTDSFSSVIIERISTAFKNISDMIVSPKIDTFSGSVEIRHSSIGVGTGMSIVANERVKVDVLIGMIIIAEEGVKNLGLICYLRTSEVSLSSIAWQKMVHLSRIHINTTLEVITGPSPLLR